MDKSSDLYVDLVCAVFCSVSIAAALSHVNGIQTHEHELFVSRKSFILAAAKLLN